MDVVRKRIEGAKDGQDGLWMQTETETETVTDAAGGGWIDGWRKE